MVNIVNIWQYKPIYGNSYVLDLPIFHSRELYNGLGEAIYPTIVAINIQICYNMNNNFNKNQGPSAAIMAAEIFIS